MAESQKNDSLPETLGKKQLSKEEVKVGKLLGEIEHEPDMMATVKVKRNIPISQKKKQKEEDFLEKSVKFQKIADSCLLSKDEGSNK